MENLIARPWLAAVLSLILLACMSAYGQLTPLGDSYTNTATPTTNYGAKTLLDVDGATQITYIQFSLASIPASASISQATLKLYVNTVTSAGSFNVDYVNGVWTEGAIDASDAPALGSTIASGVVITAADKNQYILINVTSAVQAWLNGSEPNNGIALVANGSFNATFDSKENTATSHPAELDIAFAGGDGTITGVTTAGGSGLTGGGTSGNLNLALTNACAANQVLQWNGSSWVCAAVGTGTVTGVTAGTDLTGGGTSGNVTLNLNTSATNALYAQLTANNTFSGIQTINNTTFITGANSSGVLQVTNTLTSGSAPAVSGATDSTNASGLKGIASAATGTSNGVFGTSSSTGGNGVKGSSPNVGVYGQSSGASNTGAGRSEAGVWGDTGGASGAGYAGVLGTADANSAGLFVNNGPYPTVVAINSGPSDTTGVAGVEGRSSNVGVYGQASGGSKQGAGAGNAALWGDTGGAAGQYTALLATADDNTAAYIYNNSRLQVALYVANYEESDPDTAVFATSGSFGPGDNGQCVIDASGDLACNGSKSAVVPVDGGSRNVALYAIEGPENWFEDAGSAQLSNGATVVNLEQVFGQTVDTEREYHVFLTPNGDCKGLYVSQKTPTSFEVRELGGGMSSIAFDYRVMAKRKGYESIRLADKTSQFGKEAIQGRKMQRPVRPSAAPISEPRSNSAVATK
ncbi:MAG: DNRLRE domain-containing protein [Terriglobales bacterium]|jgi:hypothetical protein